MAVTGGLTDTVLRADLPSREASMSSIQERLDEILTQRGYIVLGKPKSQLPTSGEENHDPIRDFQKFYSLPETGQFDEETKAVLFASRCGVPDPRRSTKWFAEATRWQKRNLTISIENSVPGVPIEHIRSLVEHAAAVWNEAAKGRFSIAPQIAGGDIKVSFQSGYHGDAWPFSGPEGVLAHAFHAKFPEGALAGQIHFDLSESWSFTEHCPPTSKDFLSVAIHEVGHSLGLDHIGAKKSVMYSNYNGVQRQLFDFDYHLISNLYSS
ncbi:MAG: hypothetical protein C0471_12250 [Erythrobacter sp.]|nr:hypothetical protein [Erythrobacter sp.]